MDPSILADTISNLLQCMSSLKPPATRLSGKDITKLENHLKEIHANVEKAKRSRSRGELVLPWLQKVKEVVIDFNDLMDDIRLKERTSGTNPFAGAINAALRFKLSYQVTRFGNELKGLNEQAQDIPFPEQAAPDNDNNADDELEKTVVVVGRQNEKKEIIDQLILSSAPPVIAIVGVAGIGKTTLARLVCEAEQVKAHFALPIWVPGKTFNVESIVNRVTGTAPVDGKRYLLVLDDLMIKIGDKDVEKLQLKLAEAGLAGGAVLITTRSNVVVSGSKNKVKSYPLNELNAEDSLSLFQQIHGRGGSNDIESEMIRDCFGVPRAIIIMARLLKGRDSSVSESEVPALRREFMQKVYDDLPSYQKQCFAYCSLFPRDYLIDAERLIQLWLAEGFISMDCDEEFGRMCFDNLVPFVFQQVEAVENVEDYEGFGVARRKYYRMNPLMHEVARLVAMEENVSVDTEGKKVHDRGVLRVSFDFALTISCGIPDSVFEKAKKLRSILLPAVINRSRLPHEVKMTRSAFVDILETFKATLRVLDVHDLGIKTVPSAVEEMKRLRFLDLSHSNIEKLPNSITKLSHLQTLKLSRCHLLKELPKDLGDLSCLIHLDIEGCLDLTHMPRGIKKLTSLQTLSLFVVSWKTVFAGLKELTDLQHLRGHLEISHLEQLGFYLTKEEECLKNKDRLEGLTLRWDRNEDREDGGDTDDANDKDKKSLEHLEPHPNLRALLVVGYNGRTFSDWLSSVQGLVKFSMSDSPRCQFLPPLDQLPHLKSLELRRLDSLEFITKNNQDEEEKTTPLAFFPSLKELTISDCPQLRSWWKFEKGEKADRPSFPCISKLHIQCCPKLACMPLYPYLDEELVVIDSCVKSVLDTRTAETTTSEAGFLPFSKLKSMHIAHFNQSPPDGWFNNFTSLEKFHIQDYPGLKSIPQGFKSLRSLQILTIERCVELDLNTATTEWEGLENLRSLTVRGVLNLESLPWGVESVKSLQKLGLYECPNLTSLPESIGKLESLTKLVISDCKKLDSLPKGMECLKSLNTLIITDCPLLLPRCQPETGDDWPQIAHIKHIIVKQTSHDSIDL